MLASADLDEVNELSSELKRIEKTLAYSDLELGVIIDGGVNREYIPTDTAAGMAVRRAFDAYLMEVRAGIVAKLNGLGVEA
jgi:hypothetical protein